MPPHEKLKSHLKFEDYKVITSMMKNQKYIDVVSSLNIVDVSSDSKHVFGVVGASDKDVDNIKRDAKVKTHQSVQKLKQRVESLFQISIPTFVQMKTNGSTSESSSQHIISTSFQSSDSGKIRNTKNTHLFRSISTNQEKENTKRDSPCTTHSVGKNFGFLYLIFIVTLTLLFVVVGITHAGRNSPTEKESMYSKHLVPESTSVLQPTYLRSSKSTDTVEDFHQLFIDSSTVAYMPSISNEVDFPITTTYTSQRSLQNEVFVDELSGGRVNEVCSLKCCMIQHDIFAFDNTTNSTATNFPATDDDEESTSTLQFAFEVIGIIFLLILSGLFAGLVLGVLGLDITGLEIVMGSDDPKNAEYARRLLPIRKSGNLVLCTLVVGNVCVNSLLSILLGDKLGGTVGFLTSSVGIVIFGEILPQAAFSRYALPLGSFSVPIVRFFIFVFYPITKPLALALDYVLGHELLTIYNEGEMLKLLQIHATEKAIDQHVADVMTGALQYQNKTVDSVMTPVDKTYMINIQEKLSYATIAEIFKSGYSRIPVYEIHKNNVVGLLFVKDLIFLDPEDSTPIADFIEIFGRQLHVVWSDDKLGDVLFELKKGKSHMALVREIVNDPTGELDPKYTVSGIITLEDIIEEIIGSEIVDETDNFSDNNEASEVDREQTFEWAKLRLLDNKIVDETLSVDEAKAVVAHLQKNYAAQFSLLTEKQLFRLVSESPILTLPPATFADTLASASPLSTSGRSGNVDLPLTLMYEKNKSTDTSTLILSGKVAVILGENNGFRTEVGSWFLMCENALNVSVNDYIPDFYAYVTGDSPCRCIQISRRKFNLAMDASAYERTNIIAPSNTAVSNNSFDRSPDPITILDGQRDISKSDSSEPKSKVEKLLLSMTLNPDESNKNVKNLTKFVASVNEGTTTIEQSEVISQNTESGNELADHHVDAVSDPETKQSLKSDVDETNNESSSDDKVPGPMSTGHLETPRGDETNADIKDNVGNSLGSEANDNVTSNPPVLELIDPSSTHNSELGEEGEIIFEQKL